jgi:hypothetical protein
MATGATEEVLELAKTIVELGRLSNAISEAEGDFRRRALEALRTLNAVLEKMKIPGTYRDLPFYSRLYGAYDKWEWGYRLVLTESAIKVEEFDDWRSYMYPETEDPLISFESLETERIANAIERLPEFLQSVAEELRERGREIERLTRLAEAILSAAREVGT